MFAIFHWVQPGLRSHVYSGYKHQEAGPLGHLTVCLAHLLSSPLHPVNLPGIRSTPGEGASLGLPWCPLPAAVPF